MFKKVLLPLDLSKSSLVLLDRIETLKDLGLETLYILTIIDMEKVVYTHFAHHNLGIYETMIKRFEQDAQEKLSEVKEEIEKQGVRVETELVIGPASDKILSSAEKNNVDLILISASGENFLKRILGSVTTKVINHSNCPVLVEQLKEQEEKDTKMSLVSSDNPFEHILYVTDFSDASLEVFEKLGNFAELIKKVTIFHVQEKERLEHAEQELDDYNETDLNRMKKMAGKLKNLGIEEIDIEIKFGHPKKLIPEMGKNCGATMIALAGKGRTNLSEVLLGSTAYNVIRNSYIPVLLWRNKEI